MKKNGLLIFGIIICLAAGYLLVTNVPVEHTSGDDGENSENNSEENSDNVDEKEEDNGNANDQRDVLDDLMDESKQFPSEYVTQGKKCKALDDTLERGDCFQNVNENHLDWYIQTEKDEFYFPVHHGQYKWKNIFYYTIDESDELGTLHKTDYYDEYEGDSDALFQRAENAMNENWYIFSNIIPETFRQDLKYVYWADTGDDMAFSVGRHEDQPEDMTLTFSHMTRGYYPENKTFLIHEFGHMLTMNEQQVKIDEEVAFSDDDGEEEVAQCETYYTGWGCPEEDSYLKAFFNQFWEDIYEEFETIDWDDETDYKEFFLNHEERFMNSYQGTNPAEDIAESFSQFVMIDSHDIAEESKMKYDKLQFFYDYDELVELRTDILENIYDLSVNDAFLY